VRKYIAVVAAAVALAVLPIPPALVERFYSERFYPPLQHALTSASNRLPVALFDILLVSVAVGWLAFAIRDVAHAGLVRAAPRIVVRSTVWAATLYLLFLAVWGLNYRRVRLADKVPFDASAVTAEAATRRVNRERIMVEPPLLRPHPYPGHGDLRHARRQRRGPRCRRARAGRAS